jgi:hypothetical protein
MSKHLTEPELLDLAEGAGGEESRAHASGCASCAARVRGAGLGLGLARGAEVPEPSPLYWQAFRRQVGDRIAREARHGGRAWRLPALAAAAALVAAVSLVSSRDGPAPATPEPALLPAWSGLPPAEDDPGLLVLQALAARGDGAGAVPDEEVSEALVALSEDESRALVEALRVEGRGIGL